MSDDHDIFDDYRFLGLVVLNNKQWDGEKVFHLWEQTSQECIGFIYYCEVDGVYLPNRSKYFETPGDKIREKFKPIKHIPNDCARLAEEFGEIDSATSLIFALRVSAGHAPYWKTMHSNGSTEFFKAAIEDDYHRISLKNESEFKSYQDLLKDVHADMIDGDFNHGRMKLQGSLTADSFAYHLLFPSKNKY